MHTRVARSSDVIGIYGLQRTYDIWCVGAPEDSESEVRDTYLRAENTQVVLRGDDIVGYAAYWRTGSHVVAHPGSDMEAIYRLLVHWLTASFAPEVRASACDEQLRRVAARQGWRLSNLTFDLLRPVTPDWVVGLPSWQRGYSAVAGAEADHSALHRLIYRDAHWPEMPGHHDRGLDEWQRLFLQPAGATEPLVAWHSDRMVGAALSRVFDDGTGWITQLAVVPEERRRGIARNLLLQVFRLLIDSGVTSIGLGVSAANRAAIGLYVSLGLEVRREWAIYLPPPVEVE